MTMTISVLNHYDSMVALVLAVLIAMTIYCCYCYLSLWPR